LSEPLLQLTWTDPETGRAGHAVIDRLIGGLAGGGIRMRAGVTADEVAALALAMSRKKGIMRTFSGGAKGGIDCDPRDPAAGGVLQRYVRAMSPLFRCWSAAGDLGVNQRLLDQVFEAAGLGLTVQATVRRARDPAAAAQRVRHARTLAADGVPLPECIGGYGVAEAAAAASRHLGRDIGGATVVIHGFGSMGGSAARYLSHLGAKVVGVADVNGMVVNAAGLDVEALTKWRGSAGELDRSRLLPGDRFLPVTAWPDVACDVLVPASVADLITADNAGDVKAGLVVEAANLPTTDAARRILAAGGVMVVPDLVASAATTAWWTWTAMGTIAADVGQAISKVHQAMDEAVVEVLSLAQARDWTTHEAAVHIAERNLRQMEAALTVAR
jgi:glutamate dehydrogenase (NAD(P)+)